MWKLKLIGLIVCWTLTFVYTLVSEGAPHRRMSSGQVYQMVEKYRLVAQNAKSEKARRNALRPLRNELEREVKIGLKFNDETLFLANRVLLQVEYILGNNCSKAKDLLLSGTNGADESSIAGKRRDREVREGLYLYQSVCN